MFIPAGHALPVPYLWAAFGVANHPRSSSAADNHGQQHPNSTHLSAGRATAWTSLTTTGSRRCSEQVNWALGSTGRSAPSSLARPGRAAHPPLCPPRHHHAMPPLEVATGQVIDAAVRASPRAPGHCSRISQMSSQVPQNLLFSPGARNSASLDLDPDRVILVVARPQVHAIQGNNVPLMCITWVGFALGSCATTLTALGSPCLS